MHKTLARQIDRYLEDMVIEDPKFHELFEAVSATYEGLDQDRLLIERSLDISSKEMRGLIALLQTTLDSIGEGIIVIDIKGHVVNYNKRFLEIWQVPEEIMETKDSEKVVGWGVDKVFDPKGFQQKIDEAFASANDGPLHVIKFKDGRTVEVNSKPQIVDGVTMGRVWSFRDITKHLITEDELKTKLNALERLNKAMIDRELKMVELKKKIAQLESTQ
jgi:PAS domain S-box-containing protein